jgi:hypothetical protein
VAPESVDAVNPYIVRFSALTCTMYLVCGAANHRKMAFNDSIFNRRSHVFPCRLSSSGFEHVLTAPGDIDCATLSSFKFLNWPVYPKAPPIHLRGLVQVSVCAQMFEQCETSL